MLGPLFRSLLCSSTSSSSSSSYRSTTSPTFKSSLLLLQRVSGLDRRHFSPAPASASASASSSAAPAPAPAPAPPGRSFNPTKLRNIAVIGHVDHGKTTLMDRLLRQCVADIPHEQRAALLDNNNISSSLERGGGGGGITISSSSKVTSIPRGEHELHMVDTPGHADFVVGGEGLLQVERVVGMVEGAVLVVDAGEEPPLAQTKFVLAKALKYGLRPLLLLNNVDRPSVSEERCDEVKSLVFDIFANLGAKEEQLDFPVLYASAKEGWASSTFTKSPPENSKNMAELLDAIVQHVPYPTAYLEAPFQMLATSIPWGEHELNMVDTPGHTDFGDEVVRAEFERWMSEHGRHYKDKNEWNFRFGIYKAKLRYVDYMNSQNLTYTVGINQFADMTIEEFRANFGNGFKFPTSYPMRASYPLKNNAGPTLSQLLDKMKGKKLYRKHPPPESIQ